MIHRLGQLYESVSAADLFQIGILAVAIYLGLHLLGKTCGPSSSIGRGLGLVILCLFLAAQVVIAALDLTELGHVLDYLLTTVLLGLLVIFQPELRRALMVLGRSTIGRYLNPDTQSLAERLAVSAEALSRDCVGALIAIQREVGLGSYIETGERIDGEFSSALIRCIFTPRSPLHDGAVIMSNGRIIAAACQLPLVVRDGKTPELPDHHHLGMRHRAALCLSEETDALLLVVSEETGRISLAQGGKLETVPREHLARRLGAVLSMRVPLPLAAAA